MPSQHRNQARAFRPEDGEWNPAEEILTARGLVPGAFLRACLRWLASDPDAALDTLEGHWPGTRPLGRPRRDGGPETGSDSSGVLGLAESPERADHERPVLPPDEDVPGAS
ncbi:MAG TPA: hypothetical protein VH478_04570 [Trebonia sp.]|nr:hypothetical protein [Trebonia sp.]